MQDEGAPKQPDNDPEGLPDDASGADVRAKDSRRGGDGELYGALRGKFESLTPEELRELVPEETIVQAASLSGAHIVSIVKREHFTGPLPPANVLESYETVVPGSAKAILENFGHQGEHRRKSENRGQIIAFSSLLLVLLTVLGCAWMNAPWPGAVVAAVGLSGLFLPARVFRLMRDSRGRREAD